MRLRLLPYPEKTVKGFQPKRNQEKTNALTPPKPAELLLTLHKDLQGLRKHRALTAWGITPTPANAAGCAAPPLQAALLISPCKPPPHLSPVPGRGQLSPDWSFPSHSLIVSSEAGVAPPGENKGRQCGQTSPEAQSAWHGAACPQRYSPPCTFYLREANEDGEEEATILLVFLRMGNWGINARWISRAISLWFFLPTELQKQFSPSDFCQRLFRSLWKSQRPSAMYKASILTVTIVSPQWVPV